MKKCILIFALTIVSASLLTPVVTARPQDDGKGKTEVIIDSIRSKSKQVADGAKVVADSTVSKSKRFGNKAAVQADTIKNRSKRAWRALTGKDQKKQKTDD